VNDRGIAEANVHRRQPANTLERAIQCLLTPCARLFGTRLHVRLVDLHDIRARLEQIANFLVDRDA
jgi:hypothetical protein